LGRADPDGAEAGSVLQIVSMGSAIDASERDVGHLSVGTAAPVHAQGQDTSAPSNAEFSDKDRLRDKASGELAAPVMASSSRPGGYVHDRVLAEFDGDWLSDALLTNLAAVG